MNRLTDIAIRIEAPIRAGGLGGGTAALLSELVGMLERVALGGAATTIDLRSLPMSPQDRIELQGTLGRGEVQATLSAEGDSTLQETRFSGVWWVQHRDKQGELIAELIEVAAIPQILAASRDEMAASAQKLRECLSSKNEARPRADRATVG